MTEVIITYYLDFRRIHNVLNASTVQMKTQYLPRKGKGLRKEKVVKEIEGDILLILR